MDNLDNCDMCKTLREGCNTLHPERSHFCEVKSKLLSLTVRNVAACVAVGRPINNSTLAYRCLMLFHWPGEKIVGQATNNNEG